MRENPTFRSGRLGIDYDHVETRGVLAGAYLPRHHDAKSPSYLTHLVFIGPAPRDEELRTGCRQPVDNVVDVYGHSREELRARPTCPTCAAKWDKIPAELRGGPPERREENPRDADLVIEEHAETVPGYQLGLGSGRQQYAKYTWPKAVALAKREAGSSNALGVELQVLRWDASGQQIEPMEFGAETLRSAKEAAKEHVRSGGSMAEVRGRASRLFAQRGFGDRANWNIMTVEPKERSPNGGYYVWVIGPDGESILEGPFGPHERDRAEALAKEEAARDHRGRVVSRGGLPTAPGFGIHAEFDRLGRRVS